jgi:hypothetical protein
MLTEEGDGREAQVRLESGSAIADAGCRLSSGSFCRIFLVSAILQIQQ